MPKHRLFLCILLMGLLFLCSCQHPDHGTKFPSNDSLANSPINYFYFSESNSYFKRVQGYEFRDENGKYTVYFHLANEETAYPVTVDQEWANTLKSCIEQYGIMRWNGFKGSARNLLDGTHFFIHGGSVGILASLCRVRRPREPLNLLTSGSGNPFPRRTV